MPRSLLRSGDSGIWIPRFLLRESFIVMKPRSHELLERGNTLLLVIDLQEPFLRNIHQPELLLSRCKFLLESATVLGVPVIASTQYEERMGPLIPEIQALMPAGTPDPVKKITFSAAATHEFTELVASYDREQILICGVETHICVAQTALDLAHLDYQVHVTVDAVSSRSFEMHKLGMEKMRDCGILPNAAEGAVMELLYEAGTPDFKSILRLIK